MNKAKGLVAVKITDLLPKKNILSPDSYKASTAIHRTISKITSKLELVSSYLGRPVNALEECARAT